MYFREYYTMYNGKNWPNRLAKACDAGKKWEENTHFSP